MSAQVVKMGQGSNKKAVAPRFKKGDLVQLRSEMNWNPSLFWVRTATRKSLVLGQLSDTHHGYIGLDTGIDLADPEDVADVVPASPEILAMYVIHANHANEGN